MRGDAISQKRHDPFTQIFEFRFIDEQIGLKFNALNRAEHTNIR
jgi:hypothetical protein